MEVSNQELELYGQELVQLIVSHTGLPEGWVHQELDQIFEKLGFDQKNLTLEQFREAMLVYLEMTQAAFLAKNP